MLPFDGPIWILVGCCALLVGLSKTGLPGAGIVVIPVMAGIMPARASTGFLLPLLVVADLMAILYWRRHVAWSRLWRLLPWTMAGVVAGYFSLKVITDQQLMPVIGLIVLAMIGLRRMSNARESLEQRIPTWRWFAGATGILAGGASMMANAAGPIMVIYMLAMKMKKKELIGTTAWFFWILNLSKIPFSSHLDLIDSQSLLTDLVLVPFILAGGAMGIFLVHRIPQQLFNLLVEILAAAASCTLCLKPLL